MPESNTIARWSAAEFTGCQFNCRADGAYHDALIVC
jgi:hypothetical protein